MLRSAAAARRAVAPRVVAAARYQSSGASGGNGGDDKDKKPYGSGTATKGDARAPPGTPEDYEWGRKMTHAPIYPGQMPSQVNAEGNIDMGIPEDFKLGEPPKPGVETAFNFIGSGTQPGHDYKFRQGVKAFERTKSTPKDRAEEAAKRAARPTGDRPPRSVDEAEEFAGTSPQNTKGEEGYVKSKDAFAKHRVVLEESFAGDPEAQRITWLENIWWNYFKYLWTRDILVGKDRWGNHFTASWYFIRSRHEIRKCHRKDAKKQFQPYGALPTDDRLWEAWLRGWRNDPPTIAECDAMRKRRAQQMGVHKMEGEEVEDTMVRLISSTRLGSGYMQELDEDQKYADRILVNTDERAKEANVSEDWDATWSAGFVRGDQFYNEEEVENMRTSLSHIYRDREWQTLEMKRQTKLRKAPHPIGKPDDEDMTSPFAQGKPVAHDYDRMDSHVPMHQGIADLTTPELERLRAECDALEDERIQLRKELGLSDLTDFREGRESVDKGYDPFQPPPTSGRWKPKVWQESWGVGGANPY